MLWFCESICQFPARCARRECAFGPTRAWDKYTTFERLIIEYGVKPSRGDWEIVLTNACDVLGSIDDVTGCLSEALRCRMISEVQVSSEFGNRAETSGFYSAGFLSDSATSAEPVVLSHVRDFISASSFRSARGGQDEFIQQAVREVQA